MDGRLLLLFALSSLTVTAEDQRGCEYSKVCEVQKRSAPLGSSVLLPCDLRARAGASNITEVSWTQTSERDLVLLTSSGRVHFSDPRYGRVKAFPNQGSEVDFTIRIDKLEASDLGCYFCKWDEDCFQVDLVAEKGPQSENLRLVIFTCVSVSFLILVCVGGYFCVKRIRRCDKSLRENTSRENTFSPADVKSTSAPPAGPSRVHFHQQRGVYINDLVYENDNHDPTNQQGESSRGQSTLPANQHDVARTQPDHGTSGSHQNSSQFKFVRMDRRSTKRRFHTELFNKLRQASFSRHYYVNRGEINNQEETGASHVQDCEYKNPIYNRSTDRLDQM